MLQAWNAVWAQIESEESLKQHTKALCMLLSNPLEVVQLACNDEMLVLELCTISSVPTA